MKSCSSKRCIFVKNIIMKSTLLSLLCLSLISTGLYAQRQTDDVKTDKGILKITPIMHASLVMQWKGKTIYVDPAGKPDLFSGLPLPDMILVTDIHGDHMDTALLKRFSGDKAIIVAPRAVADLLPAPLKKKTLI